MKFTDKVRIATFADLDRELPLLIGRIDKSRLDESTKSALISLARGMLEPIRTQLQAGARPMSARRVFSSEDYHLVLEVGPRTSPMDFLSRLMGR